MYKKARNNEINNFIGIHVNYESPTNPELIIDTENSTVDHNVQIILDYLKEIKVIKNSR
jgi:adenylylsulfate kinase-like enzyme